VLRTTGIIAVALVYVAACGGELVTTDNNGVSSGTSGQAGGSSSSAGSSSGGASSTSSGGANASNGAGDAGAWDPLNPWDPAPNCVIFVPSCLGPDDDPECQSILASEPCPNNNVSYVVACDCSSLTCECLKEEPAATTLVGTTSIPFCGERPQPGPNLAATSYKLDEAGEAALNGCGFPMSK
jgi:hypothetical protein